MNCIDYFDKLYTIILDQSQLKEIDCSGNGVHPILANENKIKGYLYRSVRGTVDDSIYKYITPSGSQPGKAYGLLQSPQGGQSYEACYIHAEYSRIQAG